MFPDVKARHWLFRPRCSTTKFIALNGTAWEDVGRCQKVKDVHLI